jgi:hypothetical protein
MPFGDTNVTRRRQPQVTPGPQTTTPVQRGTTGRRTPVTPIRVASPQPLITLEEHAPTFSASLPQLLDTSASKDSLFPEFKTTATKPFTFPEIAICGTIGSTCSDKLKRGAAGGSLLFDFGIPRDFSDDCFGTISLFSMDPDSSDIEEECNDDAAADIRQPVMNSSVNAIKTQNLITNTSLNAQSSFSPSLTSKNHATSSSKPKIAGSGNVGAATEFNSGKLKKKRAHDVSSPQEHAASAPTVTIRHRRRI